MIKRTTIQIEDSLRKDLKVLAARRDISYQDLLKDMISVFKELDSKKSVISLPSKLVDKIKNKIEGTDFTSVSEYTTFILRQILIETLSKDDLVFDEEVIKNKLRTLGYL